MLSLDLIIFFVLLIFFCVGFYFGFIHAVGSLAGFFVGLAVANKYYIELGGWLVGHISYFANHQIASTIVAYFILLVITSRIIGIAFYFFEKIFRIIKIIPFLSLFNRVSGGVFGLVEGVLFIGVALLFIQQYPLVSQLTKTVAQSASAQLVLKSTTYLLPLLPQAFNQLQGFDWKSFVPNAPQIPDQWRMFESLGHQQLMDVLRRAIKN